MPTLTPLVVNIPNSLEIFQTTFKPFFDALEAMQDTTAMLMTDVYIADVDHIIPTSTVMIALTKDSPLNPRHTGYYHAEEISDPTLKATAYMVTSQLGVRGGDIIHLLEYLFSIDDFSCENGRYLRVWFDRTGIVTIMSEDMDGWLGRNEDDMVYNTPYAMRAIARGYIVDTQTGHEHMTAMENLTTVHKRLASYEPIILDGKAQDLYFNDPLTGDMLTLD